MNFGSVVLNIPSITNVQLFFAVPDVVIYVCDNHRIH